MAIPGVLNGCGSGSKGSVRRTQAEAAAAANQSMYGIGAYNAVRIPPLTPHGVVHHDTLTRRPVLPLHIGGTHQLHAWPGSGRHGPGDQASPPLGSDRCLPYCAPPLAIRCIPQQSRRQPLPLTLSPLVAVQATRESTTAPPLVSRWWSHSFPTPASSARRSEPLRR